MYAFEDQEGTKSMFQDPRPPKGRRWKHFISRVQGLPLAGNGTYDKYAA